MPEAPGADRRGRAGVGKDIEKERTAEPQHARDQRERDQPDDIVAVDPPQTPAKPMDRGRGGGPAGGLGGPHQPAGPRGRPLLSAAKTGPPARGGATTGPPPQRR